MNGINVQLERKGIPELKDKVRDGKPLRADFNNLFLHLVPAPLVVQFFSDHPAPIPQTFPDRYQ